MKNLKCLFSGEFRHELLMKTARWNNNTPLIEAVKVIVDTIDEPNTDYPINHGLL